MDEKFGIDINSFVYIKEGFPTFMCIGYSSDQGPCLYKLKEWSNRINYHTNIGKVASDMFIQLPGDYKQINDLKVHVMVGTSMVSNRSSKHPISWSHFV